MKAINYIYQLNLCGLIVHVDTLSAWNSSAERWRAVDIVWMYVSMLGIYIEQKHHWLVLKLDGTLE